MEGEAIRLDAMITQSHRAIGGDFQYVHSKQHRSDLPQLKTMLATLDSFAMPLFSVTVAGNTADNVLYLPVLRELMDNLTMYHQLFVGGDSKMDSLLIRSQIQYKDHFYLVPLSKKQCTPKELDAYLADIPTELVTVSKTDKKGTTKVKAKAFERTEKIVDDSLGLCWEERRLIVYSPAYANQQKIGFEDRLAKAQTALELLLVQYFTKSPSFYTPKSIFPSIRTSIF